MPRKIIHVSAPKKDGQKGWQTMKRLLNRSISLLLAIAMLATLMLPAAAAVADGQLQNPPDYEDTTPENDLDDSGDPDPGADDPTTDDPTTDDPVADDPASDNPGVDDPGADDPDAGDPTADGFGIAPQSNSTPPTIPGYTQVTDTSYLLAGHNYLIVAQGENGLYALYPRTLSAGNGPGSLPPQNTYGPRFAKLTVSGNTVTAQATAAAASSDTVGQSVQMADLCTTFIPFGGGYYHIASASTPTLYLAMDGNNMFSTTANNVEVSAAQTGSFTFHATYGNGSNRYLVFSEYGTSYQFSNKGTTFGTDFWGPNAQQGAPVYIFVEGDSLPTPSITLKDPSQATPGSTVMYFSKTGGSSGNGWELSEDPTNAALTFTDATTNAAISSLTANATFKISSGNTYLTAPYSVTTGGTYSTSQGTADQGSSFTLAPGADGSCRIHAVNGSDSGWMTQAAADFNLNGADWKGVAFDASGLGAEFFIGQVSSQSGQYYIWYEVQQIVKTPIAFKTPAANSGMVPHYLTKAAGNGWKFSPAQSAVTIRDENAQAVTNGLYSDSVYQIHSGKYLGVFTPSATNTPSAGDYGSAVAASKLNFNLISGSTDSFSIGYGGNFMTSTVKDITHNNQAWTVIEFGSQAQELYISPADQSAGTYYIWYLAPLGPGAAIAEMFDTSPDNTWVFTGGKDVEGGWARTQGHRNFMGQFEEYIRWQNAGDAESAASPSTLRQRYTINTAYEGLTLAEIVTDTGWAKYVANFNPRAAVYMVGTEDQSDSDFETHLSAFISKSLALRNNDGFAVIIKSWDSTTLSTQNAAVDTVLSQFTDQQSRIVVVDPTNSVTAMDAAGHLELGRQLCLATIGSASSYPCSQGTATFTEKAAPTAYDTSVVPTVSVSGTTMTITMSSGVTNFTYELRLDNGLTLSGAGSAGTATVTDVPENVGYTLVTRNGNTQYKTIVSGQTLTAQQQALVNLVNDKNTPRTWLFMGDSITHGALWTKGYDSISQSFDKYLDMLGRNQDVVINSAVSSADTGSTLTAIQYRLQQFSAARPDVAVIMLGTNDYAARPAIPAGTDYKTNLQAIINAIKTINPNAIIILRSPTGNWAGRSVSSYCEAMEQVAAQNGLIYVDQYTDTQWKLDTYSTWIKGIQGYYGNNLHPGAEGQLDMTKMFLKATGLWDEDTPIANLDYELTTAETTTLTDDVWEKALARDGNNLTLQTNVLNLSLGQTTLTATNAAGQSWSRTVKSGSRATLTLPDGTYTITISGISQQEAKTLTMTGKSITLPDHTDSFKEDEPPFVGILEYKLATGTTLEPGNYAVVASTTTGSDRHRIMHMQLVNGTTDQYEINQCQIQASETAGQDKLAMIHDGHLFSVAKTQSGTYTFQVLNGQAEGKYMTVNGNTLTLGDTATEFNVASMDNNGFSIQLALDTGKYAIWNGNFKTTGSAAYKFYLYRETPNTNYELAQTHFSGTSDEPMDKADTNSRQFRIPSLVTLQNGWLMAASDIRWQTKADSPQNLDTIVSISKDGGTTWEWEVVNYLADQAETATGSISASYIDPAVVQSADGTIWMLVDLQPPYVNGGKIGNGMDSRGHLKVGKIPADGYTMNNNHDTNLNGYTYDYCVDINRYGSGRTRTVDMTALGGAQNVSVHLWPIRASDETHAEGGIPTGYYVDAFFNTYYDYSANAATTDIRPVLAQQHNSTKVIHNNLFYVQSGWKAYPTAYLVLRSARVVGDRLVWGDPKILNDQIKRTTEHFLGVCPGRGITTTVNGQERIIFPVYDNLNSGAESSELASVIYSDDGGVTWRRGEHVPNGSTSKSSESQIVELEKADGTKFLRIYCRTGNNGIKQISYADSTDGGVTWTTALYDPELPYGHNTMVSFINVDGYVIGPDNKVYDNLILASYPRGAQDGAHAQRRTDGMVRFGGWVEGAEGTGVVWFNDKDDVRYPGLFSYSCLTQKEDGVGNGIDGFGLLYEEESNSGVDIRYDAFTAADILPDGYIFTLTKPDPSRLPTLMLLRTLLDMEKGEQDKFNAITTNVTNPTVVWSSSEPSVATVDAHGAVVAVGAGRTYITATLTVGEFVRKATSEIVVQDGSIITLPSKYESEITSSTVSVYRKTTVDGAQLAEGTYILRALNYTGGSGEPVLHVAAGSSSLNQCRANAASVADGTIANGCGDAHLFQFAKTATGSWIIESVANPGTYLAVSGTSLSFSETGTEFTITGSSGSFQIMSGQDYFSFVSGSWTMGSTLTNFELYGENNTYTFTAHPDSLQKVIAAVKALTPVPTDFDETAYASILNQTMDYTGTDEAAVRASAEAVQKAIDDAAKALYNRYLRPGRYEISGKVTDSNASGLTGATVTLKQGNTEVKQTTTAADGSYSFANVKPGLYNVVVTENRGGDAVTKTTVAEIKDHSVTLPNIQMPQDKKSSIVDVKPNTPSTVVDGVDQIAENTNPTTPGNSVTITLAVEAKPNPADKGTIEQVIPAASRNNVVYLDLTLTKTEGAGTAEDIGDTNTTVLEIIVSFDFSGKKNVTVYRNHQGEGAAKALTEGTITNKAEGTFYRDEANGKIHIFASKFSTYAIAYETGTTTNPDPGPNPDPGTDPVTPQPSDPGGWSGGGTVYYESSISAAKHGQITVQPQRASAGSKVTITATPDKGYQVGGVTVKDASGKTVPVTPAGNGKYTFTMPSSRVTVDVEFAPKSVANPFADVSASDYYYDAVLWAVENGITNGTNTEGTRFSPNEPCTRAQAVTFQYRAAKATPVLGANSFTDVAASDYFANAVQWAVNNGITNGTNAEGTRFSPNNTCTRGQIVTFLYRELGDK